MASRNPNDLHPDLQTLFVKFMHQAKVEGIDALCTCTYRSGTEQDALYAQGRTVGGRIVTNARSGQSAHNFTIKGKPAAKAFDVVLMQNGKPDWNTVGDSLILWQKIGKIGVDLGLNWYGSPGSKFKEYPHFQLKE